MRISTFAAAAAIAAAAQAQTADLVLLSGKIVTMSPAMPEAQALAVRGGKVAGLGTNADNGCTG